MARINIEDELYIRGEWFKLLIALKSPDTALGSLIRAWTVAQKYWFPNRELIPLDVWKREGLNDAIIESGMAEVKEDGIYVKGSEDQFSWMFDAREKGTKGGIKSGESRRAKSESDKNESKPIEPVVQKTPEFEAQVQKTAKNDEKLNLTNPLSLSPPLSHSLKKEEREESEEIPSSIPSDILETIKCTMQYPDEIIEEVRKDAWLKFVASDKPDKNWKRFVGNYFHNEKEKIRDLIRDKGSAPKTSKATYQDAQAMASKIYDTVLRNGIYELKNTLASFGPSELRAIDIFGMASEIINCKSDFDASGIKARLKTACIEALSETKMAG